jgi:hypothetical protein
MFTPGHEKRIEPAAAPGAVRPTMRTPGAPAGPPSAELTVASGDCASKPASERTLVPEDAAELEPAVDIALDPELEFEREPMDDFELPSELAWDAPVDVAPERPDDPALALPSRLTAEESTGEEQALAIHPNVPKVADATNLDKCICRPIHLGAAAPDGVRLAEAGRQNSGSEHDRPTHPTWPALARPVRHPS